MERNGVDRAIQVHRRGGDGGRTRQQSCTKGRESPLESCRRRASQSRAAHKWPEYARQRELPSSRSSSHRRVFDRAIVLSTRSSCSSTRLEATLGPTTPGILHCDSVAHYTRSFEFPCHAPRRASLGSKRGATGTKLAGPNTTADEIVVVDRRARRNRLVREAGSRAL